MNVAGPPAPAARGADRRTLYRRVTLVAGLGYGSNGVTLGVVSFALLGLKAAWGLTTHQASLVTAAVGAGQLLGGLSAGYVADAIGRRAAFGLTVGLSSLAAATAAAAPSLGWLAAAMLFMGVGFGGVAPVATSLVSEFAPADRRGALLGWTQMLWATGWLVAGVGGIVLANNLGWRGIFAVGALPLALALAGPRLIPESPRFLLAHGRRGKAEALVASLGARYGVALELPEQDARVAGVRGRALARVVGSAVPAAVVSVVGGVVYDDRCVSGADPSVSRDA